VGTAGTPCSKSRLSIGTGRDQQRAVAACRITVGMHSMVRQTPWHISAVRQFICHNVHKLEMGVCAVDFTISWQTMPDPE